MDRPGRLAATVADLPDDAGFAEALSSSANGAGLIVGTRLDSTSAHGLGLSSERRSRLDRSWLDVVEGTDGGTTFRGSDRPNPTFRHESTERFDGIVCIENEPRKMLLRHGLAMLDALRHIAETSVAADAPLLTLQCPAQLPPHTFQDAGDCGGRTVEPARSSSIAIRFTMALDPAGANVRLKIADRLAQHCLERGLGLWLRDTRPGYRVGNWFLVLAHDTRRARHEYPRAADVYWSGTSNAAQGCLPITFVGPARPGSTHAILAFLAQFPEVGVLGCSMTSLNELAFVHLQLAVNGATRPRISAVNAALPEMRAVDTGPVDVLRAVVPHLLRDGVPVVAGHEHVERLMGRAGDYRAAIGPALAVTADHVTRRIPIWVSWQLPPHGLGHALIALQRALDRLDLTDPDAGSSGAPSVEYLVRGKGKLAVSKNLVERRFSGPQGSAVRLCTDLRDAWAAELAELGHQGRPGELSVSAHESWLGQSNASG